MTAGQIPDAAARPAPRRALSNAGLLSCLVGTLAMISGRFMAGAPVWLVYGGLSAILFGWGLFALAVFRRGGVGDRQSRDVKS